MRSSADGGATAPGHDDALRDGVTEGVVRSAEDVGATDLARVRVALVGTVAFVLRAAR